MELQNNQSNQDLSKTKSSPAGLNEAKSRLPSGKSSSLSGKNKLSSIIITIALVITIGLFLYFSQQLKNEAVTSCLQSVGQQTVTDGNLSTTYPLKDIYTFCMKDKGYSTYWK